MGTSKFKDATEFCQGAFEWCRVFKWFGKTGLSPLVEDSEDPRRLRIDLVTRTTSDQWEGFNLTITDKFTGTKITQKTFWFDEYLLGAPKVIGHCGWNWYCASVGSTKLFTDAVKAYIEMWV